MPKNTPLRNRVKELRERLDIRQSALARDIGITRQTIIAIEKGRLNPSILICLKIAKLLREPVDYIFYLEPGFDYAAEAEANANRPKRGRKKRSTAPTPEAEPVVAPLARPAPEVSVPVHDAERDAAAVEYEEIEQLDSEVEAEEIELIETATDAVPPKAAEDDEVKADDPKGGQAIWDFF